MSWPVVGFFPSNEGFAQSALRSKGPMYASVKSVSVSFASVKVVPERTALTKMLLLRSEPSKDTRSLTELVKSEHSFFWCG